MNAGDLIQSLRITIVTISIAFAGFSPSSSNGAEGSENLTAVLNWMKSRTDDTGTPPSDFELVAKCVKSDLVFSEMGKCWAALQQYHKSLIAKSDLIELIKAQRAAIHDIQYSYRIRNESIDADGKATLVLSEENTFTSSGAKVKLQTRTDLEAGVSASTGRKFVTAYDGEVVRTLGLTDPKENASIRAFESRAGFYKPFDLLAVAMLLRTDVDLGLAGHEQYDLLELLGNGLTVLLQETEECSGRKCLVASSSTSRVYLDIERDFAVVGLDDYSFISKPGPKGAIVSGYEKRGERRHSDVVDCGSGLWLPRKATTVLFASGKMTSRQSTEITELAVNQGVGDSVFRDVIPHGRIVHDSVRNATYVYGEKASIEEMLAESAQSDKPRSRYGLIFVVHAVAVFLIIFWMAWRRRKSRNG